MPPKIEKVIESVTLGEGPHWDVATQTLYFVDILGHTINRYHLPTKKHTKVSTADQVSIIIPIENEKNKFVISCKRQLKIISWDEESDKIVEIKTLTEVDNEEGKRENTLNDGKADALGRLWIGSIGPLKPPHEIAPEQGSLFSIGSNGEVKVHETNITVSNGMAWSSDNKKFYYIDSALERIDEFDFDLKNGTISNRKTLFSLEEHGIPGIPDGMTIDSEDNLWVAIFNGSRIIKIGTKQPETLLESIFLPAIQITSVAFGGPNLDELYVTTGAMNFGGIDAKPPENGATYKITNTGSKGVPQFNVKL